MSTKNDQADGWIQSSQLPTIPRQPPLAAEEVDPFLEYMFSAIARRPASLNFRDGARVARYLKELAMGLPGGKTRGKLDQLAEIIWATLLRYAAIGRCDKGTVLGFLKEHAKDYLAGFDAALGLGDVLDLVETTPEPKGGKRLLTPPALISRSYARSGPGVPRITDDISERIYAAYQALRQANVRGAAKRIASVLSRHGIPVREYPGRAAEWEAYFVHGRVKKFTTQAQARGGKMVAVDRWVCTFRSEARNSG